MHDGTRLTPRDVLNNYNARFLYFVGKLGSFNCIGQLFLFNESHFFFSDEFCIEALEKVLTDAVAHESRD